MVSKINPLKGSEKTLKDEKSRESHLQDMQNEMKNFFNILMIDNEKFNAQRAFNVLKGYILVYNRILYSTVSSVIYECNKDGKNKELFGTILSNVEKLVEYTEDHKVIGALINGSLGVRYSKAGIKVL